MVRFIILATSKKLTTLSAFTFQYGQIYYILVYFIKSRQNNIYIPIWLDLLLCLDKYLYCLHKYLHSNMVRFIIVKFGRVNASYPKFTFQYGQIYYSRLQAILIRVSLHLHSNMVRFIMFFSFEPRLSLRLFTFQYGQIYYIFFLFLLCCR